LAKYFPSNLMSPISENARGVKMHNYISHTSNRSKVHTPINLFAKNLFYVLLPSASMRAYDTPDINKTMSGPIFSSTLLSIFTTMFRNSVVHGSGLL